jgi:hypothetical protein
VFEAIPTKWRPLAARALPRWSSAMTCMG